MGKIIIGDDPITRRDAYLFYKANGSAGIAATLQYLGIYLASHKLELGPKKWKLIFEKIEFLWEAWWAKKSKIVEPIPLLNGDEIAAEFQLAPGEIIGKMPGFFKKKSRLQV